MHAKTLSSIATQYFKRFGFSSQYINTPPAENLKVVIVIPCYNEPYLTTTLNSLSACEPPSHPVEVIVVINSGEQDTSDVLAQNRKSYTEAEEWKRSNKHDWLKLYVLEANKLPRKHAGVGLARKIGMDEALRRFAKINYPGMIACLDADCTVNPAYLKTLETVQLERQPQSCSIYFEHMVDDDNTAELGEGILYYELFLRYYVNGLAYSGFPFAMHTIGSSMGVRADTYALSGGMNRRKAGEDFYFLHKIVPLGGFYNIAETTVYPSYRTSDRVPFGTGKAQQEWLKNRENRMQSYHVQTFDDLKGFLSVVPVLYEKTLSQRELEKLKLPVSVYEFLLAQGFLAKMEEIKTNSTHYRTFNKRFFSWFDGFKALKFVHYCRDVYYEQQPLTIASNQMLNKLGLNCTSEVKDLLFAYRSLDKKRKAII
ncbi:glycosyltransferase family A protein [Porifericola rhodea]|uniref:glycosyltransferase n=1 Tax=Porifericola rhodea TaxID=930972 RepID=UPI00266647D2|nr:glycosyltransferase family A protein [Porifericola rhodea]WKN33556.1 glycosyltransferase family A protein [Porifericola rhodea]